MTGMRWMVLAVEDALSEAVGKRIIGRHARLQISNVIQTGGVGGLQTRLRIFNNMAHNGLPTLLITDLDRAVCPPGMVESWSPENRHPDFLIRIAVREVDAWLLADRERFSEFLRVPLKRLTHHPEELADAKQEVLQLAARSRRADRRRIAPPQGSRATIGPEYNPLLGEFVRDHWSLDDAMTRSESLRRADEALCRLYDRNSTS